MTTTEIVGPPSRQQEDPMPALLTPVAPDAFAAMDAVAERLGPATALPGEPCPTCDLTEARACPACNGTGSVDFL
jgi:hypothetical protein